MRINKRRRNRRGASSVFLAIVLSALILVECMFLAFVWNLDYALSVNTALKTEIDTILCDYNRQLFDVTGYMHSQLMVSMTNASIKLLRSMVLMQDQHFMFPARTR